MVLRVAPAALLVCMTACSGNTAELAAKNTGDLTQPLAARLSPESPLEKRCGSGKVVSAALSRAPYLQKVTDTGTVVAFSASSTSPLSVEVTDIDGASVSTAAVETDASAGRDGPATLTASLTGLSPSTTYCYEIPGLTERAGFATSPPTGADVPVHFIAFGDSGSGGDSQRAVFDQMQTVPFELGLQLGDLAYNSGTPREIESGFFNVYSPILKSFAVYPVAGNHDYATDQAEPLRQAFVLPTNGDHERWYSFDRGPVHFVGLDTERIGPDQAAWLEQDLSATQLPWKILFGHRPPFSSGEHGGDAAYQRYFVPIIENHHVDLVLSGHEHDYERFKPIGGTVYVVSGGGGRETRPVGFGPVTAFSEAVLHFVYVEVEGSLLTLHAIDGVGREFDQAIVRH